MDNTETLNKDLEELDATTTAVLEEIEEESTLEEESALPEDESVSEIVVDTTAIVTELQIQNGLLQQCNDTLAIILVVVLFMMFKTYVVHIWEYIRNIGK